MVLALAELEGFEKLAVDLQDSAPRFLEWFNHTTAESEKLPLDWRELDRRPFAKLLVVRCLRPDRLTVAVSNFVAFALPNGQKYVDCDAELNSYQVLEQTYADSSPTIPIYFILSPGANIVADIDKLAAKHKMERGVSYHNISLGQGQDIVAQERLDMGHRQGHWIILNNVHLMPRWLKHVEKMLDEFAVEGSHSSFRVFMSSDPSKSIPNGILERCIKLTNDPPSGLKANLKQAFCAFSKEDYEELEPRTRGILFALCHFHAIMLERRKFGSKGFNMLYPFAIGDLKNSASVLLNYMENAPTKVPWEDLRYLFGEIMYGGHIVNDFDRIMTNEYLQFYMRDDILDEMDMFPYPDVKLDYFHAPQTSASYDKVLEQIDVQLQGDSPLAFGLHPNAEIGFRTDTSEQLFKIIVNLSPSVGGGGGGDGGSQNAAEATMQDMLELLRDSKFDLDGISAAIDDVGPYQNVFLQECERMNALLDEITRSLIELDLGFRGELTMSESMEQLQRALVMDKVADSWTKLAYPSLRPLAIWLSNLQQRIAQLQDWTGSPTDIPTVTWISGLFNPQSFLTAIMQVTAQAQSLELDKLQINTEVSKKSDIADITAPSRDGAFVNGLSLEGARWNVSACMLEASNPREMQCSMPVINCRTASNDRVEPNTFACPVYKTQARGPTYVFSAQLKTKAPSAKWVLAGVVLIMDIV
jgi:dynein heavy chain